MRLARCVISRVEEEIETERRRRNAMSKVICHSTGVHSRLGPSLRVHISTLLTTVHANDLSPEEAPRNLPPGVVISTPDSNFQQPYRDIQTVDLVISLPC